MSEEQTISFLVNENEWKLLKEPCMLGAVAAEKVDKAVLENGNYRIVLTDDELEDLAGYAAASAGLLHQVVRIQSILSLNCFLDTLRSKSIPNLG